jgi:hypothetical protein
VVVNVCGEKEEGRKMNVDIYDKKQCGDDREGSDISKVSLSS